MFKKIFSQLLDYIWPRFCLSCRQEGFLLCSSCQNKLELIPLSAEPWPGEKFYFSACFVCLDYQSQIVQKIIKFFKYQYFENLSPVLVDVLTRQARLLDLGPDAIISNAPLHTSRIRQRGFDQTFLLAKGLSNALQLPYYPLLKRQKKTKAQAKLDRTKRLANVQSAFTLNPKITLNESWKNSTIVIIDDVTTTGATLNEAAKTLQKAGFNKIICLVLAKN